MTDHNQDERQELIEDLQAALGRSVTHERNWSRGIQASLIGWAERVEVRAYYPVAYDLELG